MNNHAVKKHQANAVIPLQQQSFEQKREKLEDHSDDLLYYSSLKVEVSPDN